MRTADPALSAPSTALLCEHCGYPLDGHSAASVCPECATPVAVSLPERRTGSPWQGAPSPRSLLTTAAQTVVRPRAIFAIARMRTDARTRWLLTAYLLFATAAPVGLWTWYAIRYSGGTVLWYIRSTSAQGGIAADAGAFSIPKTWPAIAIGTLVLPAALLLLTWIETVGVRFFGRRRGWRVSGPVAWTVATHAAIGWTVGGVLHALSVPLVLALRPALDLFSPSVAVRLAVELATWVPPGTFLLGMLAFETLVYVGIRACRYANEPRAV